MPGLKSLAVLSLVPALALAFATLPARAQANCETYGQLALKQQKENEAGKCGLTGASWSSDLKGHIAWCQSVGPEKWKEQLTQRTQALAACKAKH